MKAPAAPPDKLCAADTQGVEVLMRLRVVTFRFFSALVLLAATARLGAQQNLAVKLGEVVDDRYSKGPLSGSLRVELKVEGEGLDAIKAARFVVKTAQDDTGASLLGTERKEAEFSSFDSMARVSVSLESPARKARALRLGGSVELLVPSKDPNAIAKVPNALAKKDTPLKAPGLKAAGVEVRVLSAEAYQAEKKKQKLDEKKIAEIRAEGKKRGVSDEEIDQMIELAKAFEGMGGGGPDENAVILSGKVADMEKILDVEIRGADDTPIHVGMKSSSSDGKTKTTILNASGPPPADASLVFTLLTDKSRVSLPVDLKGVVLP